MKVVRPLHGHFRPCIVMSVSVLVCEWCLCICRGVCEWCLSMGISQIVLDDSLVADRVILRQSPGSVIGHS